MPWGLRNLGSSLYNLGSTAYNAAPNLGISDMLSRGYQSLPQIMPNFSDSIPSELVPGSMGPPPPSNLEQFPTITQESSPAVIAAHPETPQGSSMLGNLGSLAGSALSGLGSLASGSYNSLPSASSVASGLGSLGSSAYNALPSAGSVASGLGSLGSAAYNALPSASSLASGAASGLGRAAGSAMGMIPEQTRNNAFENVGSILGGQLGSSIGSKLPLGMGPQFNDYATNVGKKFGNYLSSQFSNNPQSSFGGLKNIGATLGGGAAGALGGTGLGATAGSALGGYLGKKLGRYGAPVGKVLGGLLGGGLGALGGALGGGYLGNRFTKFHSGGPVNNPYYSI